MMQRASRPVGITILAVFEILFGIVGLIASLALIGLSALFTALPKVGSLLGSIGIVLGGIALFFSLIWLATGVRFLHGRRWAWTLGMIFSVLSLLGALGALAIGLITGGIGGSIFWGLMLYYLTRNHVKAFFGKGMLGTGDEHSELRRTASIPRDSYISPPTTHLGFTDGKRVKQPNNVGFRSGFEGTRRLSVLWKQTHNRLAEVYDLRRHDLDSAFSEQALLSKSKCGDCRRVYDLSRS